MRLEGNNNNNNNNNNKKRQFRLKEKTTKTNNNNNNKNINTNTIEEREIVFDTKQYGTTLYISILNKEGVSIRDLMVLEYDLGNYIRNYREDYNTYDLMLIGFNHTLKYIIELEMYELYNLKISFNNKILTNWLSKGLSKTSQKYYKIYEECINNLETIRKGLGNNKTLNIEITSKNEAKKYLTKPKLKDYGYIIEDKVDGFTLDNKTNVKKNIKNKDRVSVSKNYSNLIKIRNIH